MRILLVDDEPGVAEALSELLGAHGGFDIKTASDGESALHAARSWPEGPEVLVTDVVMEPLDGFSLRENLLGEFPNMRAVFASAYDLSDYADRLAGAAVLSKPVDVAQLVDLLSGGAAPSLPVPQIGGYLVQDCLGRHGTVDEFVAWQPSMSRHVVLHVLDEESSRDPEAVEAFLADARAKAAVSHPYLLAVHEAGEAAGRYYYTSDYLPGYSLEAYRVAGHTLDDRALLAALRTAADVSAHFKKHGISRRAIAADDLILDASLRPRLVNLASSSASAPDEQTEVAAFAAAVAELAPAGGVASAVTDTLRNGGADWAGVSAFAAAAKMVATPKDAGKLSARAEKSQQILEQSKKQQKQRLLISAGMTFVLLLVALFVLFRYLGRGESTLQSKMIRVPAGEFIYQNGERMNLPDFWIDEHEVTIYEYKKFLDFLEANPGEAERFAHPDMPKGKSHVPLDWADNKELNPPLPGYYTRSLKWGRYKDAALDVDSPVFNVDWFDAYAYAKWKGRRLPTEHEWEKAARGTDGRKFPWGNEEDPKFANTGSDFNPDPTKGGDVDGFKCWSPVNQPEGDRSPYLVRGMAGNVSEWTATWTTSEDGMGGEVPVVRGGNWENPEFTVTRRRAILDPLQMKTSLGFRTVSDKVPTQ